MHAVEASNKANSIKLSSIAYPIVKPLLLPTSIVAKMRFFFESNFITIFYILYFLIQPKSQQPIGHHDTFEFVLAFVKKIASTVSVHNKKKLVEQFASKLIVG